MDRYRTGIGVAQQNTPMKEKPLRILNKHKHFFNTAFVLSHFIHVLMHLYFNRLITIPHSVFLFMQGGETWWM